MCEKFASTLFCILRWGNSKIWQFEKKNKDIVSAPGIHSFKTITAALCFGFVPAEVYEYYDGIWYNYNYNGKSNYNYNGKSMAIYQVKTGLLIGKQEIFLEDG